MINVKNSFANCLKCDLLDYPSCILETNSKDNLNQVDIVIITDRPNKEEIIRETPLVGKGGQTYRKFHDKYIKNNFKWLITNLVLCHNIKENNEEYVLSDEIIDRCKINCFKLIEVCQPKLILLLGLIPMKTFGFGKSNVMSKHGNIYKWNNIDVIISLDPNFVNSNKSMALTFENDFKKCQEVLTLKLNDKDPSCYNNNNLNILTESESQGNIDSKYSYKIPDNFYTDNYRLVDIQYLSNSKKVLYIFRDKDNNKVTHLANDEYYCYQILNNYHANKIVDYTNVKLIKLPFENKRELDPNITYEGDLDITAKHAIDYYLNNQNECQKLKDNIMFFDIEIDMGLKNRSFPRPEEAQYPINLITTTYNGIVETYLLSNGIKLKENFENTNLKIYKTEKELLQDFIKKFKEHDPDFLSGWNSISFDLTYIFNRIKNIGIQQSSISKFNEFYVNPQYSICRLAGTIVLDQLVLYKNFNQSKRENYKLGNIAQIELGETKVELDIPINEVYYKELDKFVKYNIQDTLLLEKLENKLKHINLLNEIRKICNTSFSSGSSVLGQIDSLSVSFLKAKNKSSKNSNTEVHKETYPGAFVFPPTPGIYTDIADFDFTSLYPSLISTYNIGVNTFVMKLKDPTIGYDVMYNRDNIPEKIDVIIDPLCISKETKISKKELLDKINNDKLIYTINGCFFKRHEDEKSIFSEILENLLSSRKKYKKKMLESKECGDSLNAIFYNTRQLVYKVLANVIYGAIANKTFRFFDVSLAGSITLSGQEALKTCIFKADNYLESLKGNQVKDDINLTKQEIYGDVIDRTCKHVITGDTDSLFVTFKSFNKDNDISELCQKVQNYLNLEIVPQITRKRNVSDENNKLFLKNELISSRGLFLAKKRYAIHVISQEGKKIDETVYMGLEIKRSDFSKESKEFMKELLDLILKSKNVSLPDIFDFISQKEKYFLELIKRGDKRIAKPVSYVKSQSSYKLIPQGVKSMEAWNEIMYHCHTPGQKGYMFQISGIDETKIPTDILIKYKNYIAKNNKLETITIPDEEPKLPDFFIIDLKDSLKFNFTDRYESLLKPITEVKKKKNILSF